MASSKKFFTDDMTAEEIINLGDDILSKLDKRDLQRAVRTTALVANKRLKRLKAQAKHEGGFKDSKYVEKVSAKHKIALDALNAITEQGKTAATFGVGKNKSRNELYAELARIRRFLNMKTSTLKGAKAVRQQREKRLFKETREEALKKARKEYTKGYKKATGKNPPKKNIKKIEKAVEKKFAEKPKEVWEVYNKHQELQHLQDKSSSAHFKGYGYEKLIEEAGEMIMEGEPEDRILEALQEKEEELYIEQQNELMEELNRGMGFEIGYESSDDPFEF